EGPRFCCELLSSLNLDARWQCRQESRYSGSARRMSEGPVGRGGLRDAVVVLDRVVVGRDGGDPTIGLRQVPADMAQVPRGAECGVVDVLRIGTAVSAAVRTPFRP